MNPSPLRFDVPLGYFKTGMIDEAAISAPKKARRFPILDALRIFLAFWVTMMHFGVFPLFAGVDTASRLGRFLEHAWSSINFGTPAVIGFFVISGFCIHLPFRHDERLSVGRYYARRYIRILLPVSAALIITRLFGDRHPIIGQHSILWNSVLWSLFCEEIYYAVYPLALLVRKRFGWRVLLAPTFLIGAILAAIRPEVLDGSALGTIEAAVILYPVWLLGCILAEQSDNLPALDSARVIWFWRFLAWFGSWLGEMIYFKGHIPLTLVLLCFGVLAYFWIKKEIAYSEHHQPWAWLVSAGLWSYSLYLIHIPAMSLLSKLSVPNIGYILNWCAGFAFILALSYLFYLVVELPSHRLARRFTVVTGPGPNASLHAIAGVGQADSNPHGSNALNS
jgi:peptidoglycan/LPS O-acetylase OafA/YrhL